LCRLLPQSLARTLNVLLYPRPRRPDAPCSAALRVRLIALDLEHTSGNELLYGLDALGRVESHLRVYLERVERRPGFFFGTTDKPFDYDALIARAKKAWDDAGLQRITLHECRHSFSTFLDAAGVSETRADIYMGHANHSVSRRYRHPSQYAEDAARLDEYLSGAEAGKIVKLDERAA
jgi:hypothetical protein